MEIFYFLVVERGSNVNMRRLYGRSRRGDPAITRTPTLRGNNLEIFPAVTRESIYAYDVLDGPCNSELHDDFQRPLCQHARGLVSFCYRGQRSISSLSGC